VCSSDLRLTVNGDSFLNGGNVGIGTASPESLLTVQNDDAGIRLRSNTTIAKGLTLRYNHAGNFGQLLVDHQGNNQLAMKYHALSHSFGRSDSDVNVIMDDSGRLLVGSTTTDASTSERFLVKSTGGEHSRFVNSSDTYTPVYIKNTSTTANTNQPFLTFQDTGGNRGNFGLRYSTAQLVIQGHGGVGIAGGSGFNQDPDFFVNSSGNVGIGTSSPDALLDLEKAASGTSFISHLQVGQTGTVANSKYGIDFKNTTHGWNQGRISLERQGSNSDFDMVLSSAGSGSLVEGIRIDHTGDVTASGKIYATEYDLPSSGILDWANGDARIAEGLVNNYSLSFQTYDGTNLTTALRLDGNNLATFAGTISSGAITSTGKVQGNSLKAHVGTDDGSQLNLFADASGHCFIAGHTLRFNVGSNNARGTKLYIDSSGNAAFSGNISTTGSITAGAAGVTTQDHRMPAGAGYITYSPGNAAGDSLTIRKYGTVQQLFNSSGVQFNSGGVDQDFQVASDANTHMLFVDGGNNSLMIGNTVVNPASGFAAQAGFGYAASGQVQIAATSNLATLVLGQNQGTNGSILDFRKQGTMVGSIAVTGAGTTYNTTSDRRLKDNIETITNGTEKLMAMNPVTHGWKADPEADTVHGFIAQEMMNIVPEAVSGDPEGEEMMSMDYGRITPIIVAALQDALKEIKELKTRINELEGK
jgi:hypothetical protein